MNTQNMVYLVGAGPGDYGLLTLKAKSLIERADVLVYDNLVNERIVGLSSAACEKIYVGKSGAHHSMEQDDINRLLVDKGRQGGLIVRLKGGDPYIFGRGGEEALELARAGIPFEVVCGISSAYAAAAYAGIPVTHRGLAASVAFITGHEDPTKEDSHLHWDKLATGVQTLVFLMGVKNLPLISSELIKNGRDPKTPVAVIHRGTYAEQQTVTSTLEHIEAEVRRQGIKPPSVIVVGDVVSLRDEIAWFDRRPLFGKNIVVTRSRDQASGLVATLEDLGARVFEVPAIRIQPAADPAPLIAALGRLESYDWIGFTSANGVARLFTHLNESGRDSRALAGRKICAIGPGTAAELAAHGIKPDAVPPRFISESIVETLSALNEIQGKKFLLPRADIAPDDLPRALLDRGAAGVDDVIAYRTVRETIPPDSPAALSIREQRIDCVTFTSSSTAINFADLLKELSVADLSALPCAAIGPVTADTARRLGFTIACTAEEHTIDGLVQALLRCDAIAG
jgi:uroporphyrinogen III methyltransferase/synthase